MGHRLKPRQPDLEPQQSCCGSPRLWCVFTVTSYAGSINYNNNNDHYTDTACDHYTDNYTDNYDHYTDNDGQLADAIRYAHGRVGGIVRRPWDGLPDDRVRRRDLRLRCALAGLDGRPAPQCTRRGHGHLSGGDWNGSRPSESTDWNTPPWSPSIETQCTLG